MIHVIAHRFIKISADIIEREEMKMTNLHI